MNFIENNKLSKAVSYWREKVALDRVVEERVRGVQGKVRSFLNDVRGLLGPGAAVEGVAISAEETAARCFDKWSCRAYADYDSRVGTTKDSKSLVAVRRRMLGRRLAKLRSVFVETCFRIRAQLEDEAAPLHRDTAAAFLGDALLCPICEEFFCSEGERAPRALPCGHSLCSACLAAVLPRHGCCPLCRAALARGAAEDFPKNYFIVQLLSVPTVQKADPTGDEAAAMEERVADV